MRIYILTGTNTHYYPNKSINFNFQNPDYPMKRTAQDLSLLGFFLLPASPVTQWLSPIRNHPFCSSLRLTILAAVSRRTNSSWAKKVCTLAVFFQPTDTKVTLE